MSEHRAVEQDRGQGAEKAALGIADGLEQICESDKREEVEPGFLDLGNRSLSSLRKIRPGD